MHSARIEEIVDETVDSRPENMKTQSITLKKRSTAIPSRCFLIFLLRIFKTSNVQIFSFERAQTVNENIDSTVSNQTESRALNINSSAKKRTHVPGINRGLQPRCSSVSKFIQLSSG